MRPQWNGYVRDFIERHRRAGRDFFVRTVRNSFEAPPPRTHTFLDGGGWGNGTGILSIPSMYDSDFFDAVADDIAAGTLPALNEYRAGDVFPMYADIDIKCDPSMAVDLSRVGAVCVQQAQRFVSQMDVRCVVLKTPTKTLACPEPKLKIGCHMHFPKLNVTAYEASIMREAMVMALERELPGVDWAESFDNAPYHNGCLRMVGAPKVIPCDTCKGKKTLSASCTAPGCFSKGKLLYPSQCYSLLSCLDGSGALDDNMLRLLSANMGQLVRACSIRTNVQSVTPGWAAFIGCPRPSPPVHRPNRPPAPGNKKRAFEADKSSMSRIGWPKQEITDTAILHCLRRIFRTRFNDVYKDVDVKVNFRSKTSSYYVQLRGEADQYCLNVGRDHTHNRVYGIVTRQYAMLRCHSDKAVTAQCRSGARCAEFAVQRWLTPSDIRILFPPMHSLDASVKRSKKAKSTSMFRHSDDFLKSVSDSVHGSD